MHPYIPHLLEDIDNAYRKEFPVKSEKPQTMEEYFEEIENWIAFDPPNTFGEFCGLKVEDFPPYDQLSISDMETVNKAFQKMMLSWNLDIDLPENLPISIAYTMIVDTLNQKTAIVNDGFMTFDYCTGSPEGCIFKEYCPCLNWIDDIPDIEDMDFGDEELPF